MDTRDLSRRAPLISLVALIGIALLYATAFVGIYFKSHPYEAASRWIFENIPAGSRLLGPHWDDRLPLTLPGHDARIYRMDGPGTELLLYEPDSEIKLQTLVQTVENGDYIIFPTQRLQGSIPRIADEYPDTTAFLQLLWSGKLGYELVQTFKTRPSLFGFAFNDDLADESFSVYDHPKVTIFKNVEWLTAEQLRTRIVNKERFEPLPSMESIMRADSASDLAAETGRKGVREFLVMLVATQLLAFAIFVITAPYLGVIQDRGYGISKVLGLFIAALVTWLGAASGLSGLSYSSSVVVTLIFIAAAAILWAFNKDRRESVRGAITNHALPVEALFLGLTALFAWIRTLNPEIYWGEKPMDSALLHYLTRSDAYPPHDPWASGLELHYHYFGSYTFAWLCKLTGVAPAIGYNVAMALLGGMAGAALYSLFVALASRPIIAAIASVVFVTAGTPEALRLIAFVGEAINFDTFWLSTHHLTSPLFAEPASWSLLMAELDGYVIALPCLAVSLVLMLSFLRALIERSKCEAVFSAVLLGLAGGIVFLINGWDIVPLALFGVVSATFLLMPEPDETLPKLRATTVSLLVCLAVFLLVAVPFGFNLPTVEPVSPIPGEPVYVTAWQLIRLWGHWFLLLGLGVALSIDRFERLQGGGKRIAIFGLLPIVLVGIAAIQQTGSLPIEAIVVASLVIFAAYFIRLGRESSTRFVRTALVTSGLLIAIAELFVVGDRTLTVSKTYSSVWLLLGVSSLAVVSAGISHYLETGERVTSRSLPAYVAVGVCAVVVVAGALSATAIATTHRVSNGTQTLDGQQYLSTLDPAESQMIAWINRTVRGAPVVVETIVDSSSETARVSSHTGLPTILGWPSRVAQRDVSQEVIDRRTEAVKLIYGTINAGQAYTLLRSYGAELVVVGKLERENYRGPGLSKFDRNPTLFAKVYEGDDVTVYATSFSELFPRR